MLKNHFKHQVRNIPLVLNSPVTFVPGSVRCSSALCLYVLFLFLLFAYCCSIFLHFWPVAYNKPLNLEKKKRKKVQWRKKWLLGCIFVKIIQNMYGYTMCFILLKLNIKQNLGIHIDPPLKFNEHVTKTVKKKLKKRREVSYHTT